MNPLKRIVYLSVMIGAIGIFWLIPKINTAKDVRYTRVFENTYEPKEGPDKDSTLKSETLKSAKPLPAKSGEVSKSEDVNKEEKQKETSGTTSSVQKSQKKYIKESIEPDIKVKDVRIKMYSRAIHYNPEEEMPVLVDSLSRDTTAVLP